MQEQTIPTTEQGVPLARFDEHGKLTDQRPLARPAGHRPPEEAVVNSQRGRLMLGKTLRDQDGGSAQRDAERAQERHERRGRQRRRKQASRNAVQSQQALADLRAQIRVASGQTGASPAMVRNAQKALESKVEKLQKANPDMQLTDEQAVEILYRAAAGQ